MTKWLVLAGLLFVRAEAEASCAATPTVDVRLEVIACKPVDTTGIDPAYKPGYEGVLVTGKQGKRVTVAFVPRSQKLGCKTLAPKVIITAKLDHACCDGDANAPCLLDTSAVLSKIKRR